ncbi:exonuclease domain-containing protein [Oribacterium sp. WCC10]|uniref:exonuclease domain-containing protein n=1 Tax=Oribacterium sp. WCC10 TaxID=1855343 RepID=UPI0008ECE70E|nr:exonuclease domain-containing protein [Oribacterium sp. WCC10]SFG59572.1 Exonuclease [Oribacterium sp. WCC10]
MKHIVVDLEMNTIRRKDEARRICGFETIEIGAVMLDDNLQEIASFRTYVKPEHCDGIAKNISRLTGITDDNDEGKLDGAEMAFMDEVLFSDEDKDDDCED